MRKQALTAVMAAAVCLALASCSKEIKPDKKGGFLDQGADQQIAIPIGVFDRIWPDMQRTYGCVIATIPKKPEWVALAIEEGTQILRERRGPRRRASNQRKAIRTCLFNPSRRGLQVVRTRFATGSPIQCSAAAERIRNRPWLSITETTTSPGIAGRIRLCSFSRSSGRTSRPVIAPSASRSSARHTRPGCQVADVGGRGNRTCCSTNTAVCGPRTRITAMAAGPELVSTWNSPRALGRSAVTSVPRRRGRRGRCP